MEKTEKSGYLLTKTFILLKIYTKTPNTWDFHQNNSKLECFHAEYTKKLRIFDEIFPKNWENCITWYKISHRSNNLGRKLRKIGFFAKTGTNFRTLFLQISTCGYILAQLLKQLFFHTKQRWKYFTSHFCKNIHNHCRKHRKFAKFVVLHNRIQISGNFSPIISKTGIFSSTTAIVQQTSVNC